MQTVYEIILEWFLDFGLSGNPGELLAKVAIVTVLVVICVIANFVAKGIILKTISRLIERSKTKWDDILFGRKVFAKLSHLAPGLVIYLLAPGTFFWSESLIDFMRVAARIYMILIGFFVLSAFFDAVVDIYRTYDISKSIPIKSFVQVAKLIVFFVTTIFIISMILDRSPVALLGGLGALTAVLLLIFKDSILGLVAGVQLAANQMISRGDWIEMPDYGADGDVLDVTLATVKVQNWDKTITTIPTYKLISESFRNWRGMSESGGRRIKRPVFIDINSIRFCDEEMLRRFSRIQYISEYLDRKREEISKYNEEKKVDNQSLVNGRRITNVGTFRAYIEAYLKNHPGVNQEMTLLIRQLAPGEYGLPIEIYCFCADKRWAQYESIQADIFDHIFAVVSEFDLKVFQEPTGKDFQSGLTDRRAAEQR